MIAGKKIGAVTVTYNSASVLQDFIESMLAQSHTEFVLYVVDNMSTDGTLALLAEYDDARIVLIANQENRGVAEGNNQGTALAIAQGCDYVMLINNDTQFDSALFDKMLAASERLGADMLVPKMMYHEPSDVIWCAGGRFDPIRACSTVHFGDGEADVGQCNQALRIKYAPTCCMLIRVDVFDRIGLMDQNYFVYYDDTDFCMRANEAGLNFWYDPDAVLYHKVSSLTGGETSDFSVRICTRNKAYFILKHYGWLGSAFWLVVYQCAFLTRLLVRLDRWSTYRKKQRAFWLGVAMYRRSNDGSDPGISSLTPLNY